MAILTFSIEVTKDKRRRDEEIADLERQIDAIHELACDAHERGEGVSPLRIFEITTDPPSA